MREVYEASAGFLSDGRDRIIYPRPPSAKAGRGGPGHLLLAALGTAVLLAACTPSREIVRLQDAQTETRTKTEQQVESLRRNQADMATRLESMQFELQRLTGKFEESRFREEKEGKESSETREAQKREIKDLKDEVARLKERLTAVETALLTQKGLPSAEKAPSPAERPRDATTLYREGIEEHRAGNYEKARERFRAYMKANPKGDLAGNAQFWIGETFYSQGDYENAILAYEELASRHPKSDKLPAALLKEGLSFLELKDKTNAKLLLNRLIKKYPRSDEAKLAQRKLKTIH